MNEGGFTPLRWSSKYGLWDNTGQYDIDQAEYIDFDIMDDDELQTLYDEWLEQVGHTPRHKLGYARPDVAHALREIEKELEERGLR